MTKRSNNSQQESGSYSGMESGMGGGSGNIMYLIAGGLIGAATALLFAPKAGVALRGDIADVTRKGYDGALDLTSRVKDQTGNLVQSIREKGTGLVDAASQKFSSTGTEAGSSADQSFGSTGSSGGSSLEQGAGSADDVLSLDEGDESRGNSGMSASNGVA